MPDKTTPIGRLKHLNMAGGVKPCRKGREKPMRRMVYPLDPQIPRGTAQAAWQDSVAGAAKFAW
jgi:hypothetical protein